MKPKSIGELPVRLREHFYWEMNLSYDHYESSKAEEIHELLNDGWVSDLNRKVIETYWKDLSEEQFLLVVKNYISEIEEELETLNGYFIEK